MQLDEPLASLIALSRELGRPERELAILGEGNTSVDAGDRTFWVKASGSQLAAIDAGGFSRVRLAPVLEMLDVPSLSDAQVADGLRAALIDHTARPPSVETFMHALCLTEGQARWVAHSHPISANQILCSQLGAEPFLRQIFPDAIVVCGAAPAVVPYVDPGFALAQAIRAELRRYRAAYGFPPRLLLMASHGILALGQTASEALNITLMADKWARILVGTYAFGGPRFMSEDDVARIDSRLDEHARRQRLAGIEKL
ncbi:MAG TPA: class II aldolase/adducin family protein [Roseiflexaceae bacterium]|nr:class II aldolase/adducin family protein [Roseiflexaceae bacterium]